VTHSHCISWHEVCLCAPMRVEVKFCAEDLDRKADSWLVWQGAFEFDTEEVELGIGEVFSGVQTFRSDADHACG
jgi:hypothetical protein